MTHQNSASIVKRYPLVTYFVLAFALFFVCIPLAGVSSTLPLVLGVFAPAVAAILVSGLSEGRSAIKALLRRVLIWRVSIGWYAAAFGIPLVCGLLTFAAARWLGNSFTPLWQILPMGIVFVIFALGEEIGWRGFALPRLLNQFSPLTTALILGVVHALFHIPLWIAPGLMVPLYTFPSFVATSLCFGVLWTWLYQYARGSVLIAAVFHGAINLFGNMFYLGIDPTQLNWLMPAGYGIAAVTVLIVSRRSFFKPALSPILSPLQT